MDDLSKMEKSLQAFFVKHVDKIASMPPRRHLKFGVPHHVEDVTKQARLVYDFDLENGALFIMRCFATHKEYEKWYKSYR